MVVQVCGWRDVHSVECDTTLTEQGMEEVIRSSCKTCSVQILPVHSDQLSFQIEFYVQISVSHCRRVSKILDLSDPPLLSVCSGPH
jgi:hypothetical protein